MLDLIHQPILSPTFYLRPDVFVAFGPDAAAFLKLENDQYMGIDADQMSALSLVVHGWPLSLDAAEIPLQDAMQFAEMLVEQRFLTRDRSIGKLASQLTYAHPQDALVYRHETEIPVIRWHHVLAFARSLVSGYVWWKLIPLERTIRHVRRPKPKRTQPWDQPDLAKLRNLVRTMYWLRPWFYEKRRIDAKKQAGLCLFDSLVMLKFLEKYRLYPTLIFGVMLRPFGAHSWLQEGPWILNGSPEVVSAYECIMTAARREA